MTIPWGVQAVLAAMTILTLVGFVAIFAGSRRLMGVVLLIIGVGVAACSPVLVWTAFTDGVPFVIRLIVSVLGVAVIVPGCVIASEGLRWVRLGENV